jgi:hypothetical protein
MPRIVPYLSVPKSDLVVDAVYEGFRGDLKYEPLKCIFGVQNMGGFRFRGSGHDKRFLVLYSTGEEGDWPDVIDHNTGQFIYYGDNRSPGSELHQTQNKGNSVLRRIFDLVHGSPPNRLLVPPIFIFTKHSTAVSSRSAIFKGLAVPGYPSLPPTEDLIAVWKTTRGERFQNYRSTFTILDVGVISRSWIDDILSGNPLTHNAPQVWVQWVQRGKYTPLISEPTTVVRNEDEQLPDTALKSEILSCVYKHFSDDPHLFESFAARIFQLLDNRVIIDEVTRRTVDGGRDAVGRYLMGLEIDPVFSEFALEAKCYALGSTVGVKDSSRLISRLKHRQFGVLVTTSAIGRQAYKEVREDGHPVIFITGRDISEILIKSGYNTVSLVRDFIEKEFSIVSER